MHPAKELTVHELTLTKPGVTGRAVRLKVGLDHRGRAMDIRTMSYLRKTNDPAPEGLAAIAIGGDEGTFITVDDFGEFVDWADEDGYLMN